MRTKHQLVVSLKHQAHYMGRITERWTLLGSSLENIRRNVARDVVVAALMVKEARL